MFKRSLNPGSYLARIILPIPATVFEKTTFLSEPKYMEDPVIVQEFVFVFSAQHISLKALHDDLLSSEAVASSLWMDDMTWYGSHGLGVAEDKKTYSKYFVEAVHSAFSDRKLQLDLIVCEGKICGAHGYLTGNFSGPFLGNKL